MIINDGKINCNFEKAMKAIELEGTYYIAFNGIDSTLANFYVLSNLYVGQDAQLYVHSLTADADRKVYDLYHLLDQDVFTRDSDGNYTPFYGSEAYLKALEKDKDFNLVESGIAPHKNGEKIPYRWESDGYGGLIFLIQGENAKGELDWFEPYGNDFWDGFCEGEVPAGW